MGFIILAKGKQAIFFWSELAWTVVSLGLAWICVASFGLNGAGMAFFGSYIFHGFMIYAIVRRLSGFRWSTENKETGLLFLSLITVVFCWFYLLPFLLTVCLGMVAAVLTGTYSIRVFAKFISFDQLPLPIQRLVIGLGYIHQVRA